MISVARYCLCSGQSLNFAVYHFVRLHETAERVSRRQLSGSCADRLRARRHQGTMLIGPETDPYSPDLGLIGATFTGLSGLPVMQTCPSEIIDRLHHGFGEYTAQWILNSRRRYVRLTLIARDSVGLAMYKDGGDYADQSDHCRAAFPRIKPQVLQKPSMDAWQQV
jgi:hypothetical protein